MVILPEPSTRTAYWSNCRTSMMLPVLSHLVGCGPVWFWIRTWLPTFSGGSRLVCSDHLSDARMCRLRKASSRADRVSLHVGWGLYRPGRIGMKSFIGLPKTHCAGDSLVVGSGVFRYCSIPRCSESVSRLPCGSVLLVIRRLTVLTPISALQLECGNATEDRRWWTPQSFRNWRVAVAVNSGPPSVAHSSGMPNVANVRLRQLMRPFAPFCARSIIGQLEYLSTMTR